MNENIGVRRQAFYFREVLGLAKVQRHGPLVAIDRLKRRPMVVP